MGKEPIDFRVEIPGSRCAVIHLIDQLLFDLRNKTSPNSKGASRILFQIKPALETEIAYRIDAIMQDISTRIHSLLHNCMIKCSQSGRHTYYTSYFIDYYLAFIHRNCHRINPPITKYLIILNVGKVSFLILFYFAIQRRRLCKLPTCELSNPG